jgi:hypothetical protein
MLLSHHAEILMHGVWLCKHACHLHAIYGISFSRNCTRRECTAMSRSSFLLQTDGVMLWWPAVQVWHIGAAPLFTDLGFL